MFIFIDTETSGLDPYEHDVLECGAIVIERIADKWRVNPKKYFHKRFLIQSPDKAQEEALEICHYQESLWEKTGVNIEQGLLEFNEWLKEISPSEKPTACAFNAEFDKSMIISNCERFKIFPYLQEVWFDSLGLWVLYKTMTNVRHVGNSNKAVCNYFKVENMKAHAALADSIASAQCMAIILNKISFKQDDA